MTAKDSDQTAAAFALDVRRKVLRMIQHAGSGNPGSALSCVEILTWLMHYEMQIRREEPAWPGRDRLILSKGHAAPVFYALCSHFGWVAEEELLGFRCLDTRLQTHPEYDSIPGIDYTSGSLGQGLSAAAGMAIAARYLDQEDPRFFVLIGDGELQEGQIWEGAMAAGFYRLSNLVAIVDQNAYQGDRATNEVMSVEPLADKFSAFGWEVARADGHSFASLADAMQAFRTERPKVILASTTKGKGVSFMEGNNAWHVGGKKFTLELLQQALAGLRG